MPLNQGHKNIIEATIGHLFEPPSGTEAALTEAALREEIAAVNVALTAYTNNGYEHLSRIFHDPTRIARLDQNGPLTMGEAREGILEYVNGKIIEAAEKTGKSPEILGWHYEERCAAIRLRQDHGTALRSRVASGIEQWLWHQSEYGDVAAQPVQQLSNVELHRLLLPLEPFLTDNGKFLLQTLPPEIVIRLGVERRELLLTNEGRALLEGQPPRLTTPNQVLNLNLNNLRLMVKHQDLSYAQVWSLTPFQKEGLEIGLTGTQVQAEHFGAHTLKGIKDRPNMPVNEAFEQVRGLKAVQVTGMHWGLTREQVQTEGFGHPTIGRIRRLRAKNSNLSPKDAFELFRGLTDEQADGMVFYGLTREQVQAEHFGGHTLYGIEELREKDENLSVNEAFEKVKGLASWQVQGIVKLGLTREQVQVENFSDDTLYAIEELREKDGNLSVNEAFEKVKGLASCQVRGIVMLGLTREQVQAENFGLHTLYGIEKLREKDENLSVNEAFEKVKGLARWQVRGIVEFGLTREQVQAENFGLHTLDGIRQLRERSENLSVNEAFTQIKGLNMSQVKGIVNYRMTREEVQAEGFEEKYAARHEQAQHNIDFLRQNLGRMVSMARASQVDGGDEAAPPTVGYWTARVMEDRIRRSQQERQGQGLRP